MDMQYLKHESGFSGILLVFFVFLIAASSFGGYYLYNQHKLDSINSFEECAKNFPVMESYPAQCITSDRRHFTQTASSSAVKNPALKDSSTSASSTLGWNVYKNSRFRFSIEYPSNWQLVEPEDYYSDIIIYPPDIDLNDITPDTPTMGIRIAEERLFAESPKGNLTEQGIPMVTDWKTVQVNGVTGVYYQTHQCAPQCNRFVDFPFNNGNGTISVFISTVAREKGYLPLFERMYQSFQFH